MIERVVRNDEVVGLIPICSTILESNAPNTVIMRHPLCQGIGKESFD